LSNKNTGQNKKVQTNMEYNCDISWVGKINIKKTRWLVNCELSLYLVILTRFKSVYVR
jgi:hypothetical protein